MPDTVIESPPLGSVRTTHTPGPWSIQANEVWINAHDQHGGREAVCKMSTYGSVDPQRDTKFYEEHTANCRLVAAAPDLLAAAVLVLTGEAEGINALRVAVNRAQNGDK